MDLRFKGINVSLSIYMIENPGLEKVKGVTEGAINILWKKFGPFYLNNFSTGVL